MDNTMLGKLVKLIVTVPAEWLATLVDLLERLVGESGAEWLKQLRLFLRKEPTWILPTITKIVKRTLTVWKTINFGGTTTEALLKSIEAEVKDKEKNEIGKFARDLTSKLAFVIAPTPGQVGLVVLTPADLGFTSNPRTDAFMTKEFCAEWSAKNLDGWVIELCEAEDGPQLRLQYQDQPKGEVLWIAMERIADSDGDPYVFGVGRDDGGVRWLGTDWADPSHTWLLGGRLVFRLRKIPSPSAT